MHETKIGDDFMIDGIAVWISRKEDGGSRGVLRLGQDGEFAGWDPVTPLVDVAPTFKLDDESARSLLGALLRHYEGASDLRTVRGDLLHERDRVDRLIAALIESNAIQVRMKDYGAARPVIGS